VGMDNGRDSFGRFSRGNPGGPGRPRSKPLVDVPTLRDLANTPDGPELYVTAMMLSDRKGWVERIERDFPPEVFSKIKVLLALADYSQAEIVRRLRNLPL